MIISQKYNEPRLSWKENIGVEAHSILRVSSLLFEMISINRNNLSKHSYIWFFGGTRYVESVMASTMFKTYILFTYFAHKPSDMSIEESKMMQAT